MLAILVWLLSLFLIITPVFAGDPPTLISPVNNSQLSAIPSFSWQAVTGSVEYNILIDNEPTVTSPYAKNPYYPTNPSYSPRTLDPGTYYWKVKAKDSSGNWSIWSDIWSFTLTSATPLPTPTISSTPTAVPTATPTSQANLSTFIISNLPSQLNSNESFNASINLSLADYPNTNFYLKGAFKKEGGSNYFGFTKVTGNWIKNSNSYTDQYLITTNSSGNWSGNLEVKPDSSDSGFSGTDNYIFKVGRYTATGSGPAWSNDLIIKIIAAKDNESNSISTSTPTSIPSVKPSSSTSPPLFKITISSKQPLSQRSLDTSVYRTASVAGATSSASISAAPTKTNVKTGKQTNPLIWIGLIFILIGIGTIGYIYFKKNAKIYLKIRS